MAHADHYKEKYGSWAGNEKGNKPDFKRCCEEVRDAWVSSQCGRKCGHGPDGAYCKQHDPVAVAARRAASEAEYKKKANAGRYQWAGPKFFAALQAIANGHNDARGYAQEVIDEFKKGELK